MCVISMVDFLVNNSNYLVYPLEWVAKFSFGYGCTKLKINKHCSFSLVSKEYQASNL